MTQQETYDLLIKGGTLMDPAQGVNDRRDIAVKDGRVAQVAERIDPTTATEVLDVAGKVVTPGLIDLHGHFYHGGNPTACDANYCALGGWMHHRRGRGLGGLGQLPGHEGLHLPHEGRPPSRLHHIGATGILLNGGRWRRAPGHPPCQRRPHRRRDKGGIRFLPGSKSADAARRRGALGRPHRSP